MYVDENKIKKAKKKKKRLIFVGESVNCFRVMNDMLNT